MIKLYIVIAALLFNMSCSGQNCNQLPTEFHSFEEATRAVTKTKFGLHETLNTSKSSWIRGAEYFSCDYKTGYLIFEVGNNEYLHQGVPVGVWNDFKKAKSFGAYYNAHIKHKYQFILEKR